MAEVKHKNHYDALIVGGGLSGLLIAAQMAKAQRQILLIEEKDDVGGFSRTTSNAFAKLNFGFKSLPATPSSRQALDFVSQVIGTPQNALAVDLSPITFEGGQFKPFLGFGSTPPDYVDELDYYLSAQRLLLNPSPGDWVQQLKEHLTDRELLLRSLVTRIVIDDDGRAKGIEVNADRTLTADTIIYAGPTKQLLTLLPTGVLMARAAQRLAKASFWTTVCLDLIHSSPLSASEALHVLAGTGEDSNPCLGYVYPMGQMPPQGQEPPGADGSPPQPFFSSQWLTFTPAEGGNDPEVAGACIRRIKKQIKRAFPQAFENLIHERIYIAQQSHGLADIKLVDGIQAPGIKGLWLAGPSYGEERNLVAACLQAERILHANQCLMNEESLSDHDLWSEEPPPQTTADA